MKYTTEQMEAEATYFEEAARAESNLAHSETAAMLRQLLTQRAELLEACKAADHNSLDLPPYVVALLNQAITNTEATK